MLEVDISFSFACYWLLLAWLCSLVGIAGRYGFEALRGLREGGADGLDQHGSGKGFSEVGHAAGIARLSPGYRFIVSGDEDDGQTRTFLLEPSLQVKARHAAELDISDEEARAVMARIVQEGLGGEIGSDVVARQSQEAAQRLAHAFVVVYDCDEGRDLCHLTSMAEKPDATV
jgi:hypothetical protein